MNHYTTLNESLRDPSYRRKFEQEFLAFAATELICSLMKKQKLSKADLAKRIGKSKAFVSQVLSGSRNMTMHTFADLACALGHKIELALSPLDMPTDAQPCHQIKVKPAFRYITKPHLVTPSVQPDLGMPFDLCCTVQWLPSSQYTAG